MKHTKFFFALCSAAVLFAACEKNDEPKNDTQEAVDLGLSVKWATCNVGANTPEAYGNYYAWGEIAPKSVYTWEFYKYTSGKYNTTLTKYNNSKTYGATVDSLTTLEASDDAATQNWGGKWRVPTDAEWIELYEKCTWTWTTQNGVNGYKVKATNDSIFLPVAGYRFREYTLGADNTGHYWSSSLNTDTLNMAHQVYFDSHNVYRFNSDRYIGLAVRPVCK